GNISSLNNIQVDSKGRNGASFVSLKNLAAEYSKDEIISVLLWNTRLREEQMMACMLFPTELNKEKITQLMENCQGYEIAEYVGALHLAFRKDLLDFIPGWINSGKPFLQTAILNSMARHLIIEKEYPLFSREFFENVLSGKFEDKYVKRLVKRYSI
ncbi:MAG: hypothetical protein LIO65_07615, partial [Odoribacter sp.]|nr:hypothetical protein [Odoribacter sp.]